MANSQPPSGSIDQRNPYGQYERTQRWQDKLWKKVCHKSLDIPDDDMNVSVKKGLDWKGLAVIGATLLGAGWLFSGRLPPPQPSPPPAATDTDTTRSIEVEVGKYIPPPETDDG